MNETPQKGDVWQTIGKRGDKRRVTGIGDDHRGTIVRWENDQGNTGTCEIHNFARMRRLIERDGKPIGGAS